ncbi:hypothetical protein QAD02_017582 [Eretmocerus hayati]|uniref:Uncharacterized protein n=1 Tax=Eretmocerus hayati TaxID=131215 RepID=A0ACC2PE06_9HYME|nr:hypothetical protein QAD02_017582 [Eretmocerus hayati]
MYNNSLLRPQPQRAFKVSNTLKAILAGHIVVPPFEAWSRDDFIHLTLALRNSGQPTPFTKAYSEVDECNARMLIRSIEYFNLAAITPSFLSPTFTFLVKLQGMIKKDNMQALALRQSILDAALDDDIMSLDRDTLYALLQDIMEDFDSHTRGLVKPTDADKLQTFLLHANGKSQCARLLENPLTLHFEDRYDEYRSLQIMLCQTVKAYTPSIIEVNIEHSEIPYRMIELTLEGELHRRSDNVGSGWGFWLHIVELKRKDSQLNKKNILAVINGRNHELNFCQGNVEDDVIKSAFGPQFLKKGQKMDLYEDVQGIQLKYDDQFRPEYKDSVFVNFHRRKNWPCRILKVGRGTKVLVEMLPSTFPPALAEVDIVDIREFDYEQALKIGANLGNPNIKAVFYWAAEVANESVDASTDEEIIEELMEERSRLKRKTGDGVKGRTNRWSPSPSVAFSNEFELENERIKFGEEPDWGAEGSLNFDRANLTISGANVAFQPVFEHVVSSGDIMIWINFDVFVRSPESPSPSVAFSYEFELENERIKFGEEPDWGAEGSLNPRANLTISGANVAFQPVFEHVVPSGDIMI